MRKSIRKKIVTDDNISDIIIKKKGKKITLEDSDIMSDEQIIKYSEDMINEYNFITDNGKTLDIGYVKDVEKELNRIKTVHTFNKLLDNMNISNNIEKGCFEYTLIYTKINSISIQLAHGIYYDTIDSLVQNLDADSTVKNNYLKPKVMSGEINSYTLAFLSPQELFPERWTYYEKKRALRKYKEENLAATTNYECRKCHERKCSVIQLQTRGADEPMTNFITCLVCGNVFRGN